MQENDPRITVSKPEIKGSDGALLMAYMAKPVTGARAPGVIVIHENRGQTEQSATSFGAPRRPDSSR